MDDDILLSLAISLFLILFGLKLIIFHGGAVPQNILGPMMTLAFFLFITVIMIKAYIHYKDRFRPIVCIMISSVISISLIMAIRTIELRHPLPMLPSAVQSDISDAFARLPKGILVFSCPKKMILGISEKCRARIATEEFALAFKTLLQDGLSEDISEKKLSYISPIMNVKLTCQKFLTWKTFDIEPQEDGGNQLVISNNFTGWQWDVTPQESGKKKLKFIVSVIIRIPGYQELPPKRYEENEIEVVIDHNLAFSIINFVSLNWKYLLAIVSVLLSLFFVVRKLKIIGTNIEVGSIGGIDLKNNEGVINLLASSQNINNRFSKTSSIKKMIEDLPPSLNLVKGLLEQLRQFIHYNPELSSEQKDQSFSVVKRLVEFYYIEQDTPNIHDCILAEMDKLKETIKNGSSVEAGFNLIDKIVSILLERDCPLP